MWNSNSTHRQRRPVYSGGTPEEKVKIVNVGRLVDISMHLDLYYDGIFDNLMDKFENTPDLFNYMYDIITTMIFRKNDIEIVKIKYVELLKMRSVREINIFSYF
jgi:hypothetical protein